MLFNSIHFCRSFGNYQLCPNNGSSLPKQKVNVSNWFSSERNPVDGVSKRTEAFQRTRPKPPRTFRKINAFYPHVGSKMEAEQKLHGSKVMTAVGV